MAYIGSGTSRFNTADELTVTGNAEFNGNATITTSDNSSNLTLTSTDADANSGATARFL